MSTAATPIAAVSDPAPSPREIANRANAQLSTGPCTPEGKEAVRFNALKSGLYSKTIVLPGEDHAAYAALGETLTREFNPKIDAQRALIAELQDAQWRLDRVIAMEHNLHTVCTTESLDAIPSCFGDVDSGSRFALAQVIGFRAHARVFEQLSRHEARLRRLCANLRQELDLYGLAARPLSPAPHPPSVQPAPPVGFVPSASESVPQPPHFTGPMADIKRKQWLRRQQKLAASLSNKNR